MSTENKLHIRDLSYKELINLRKHFEELIPVDEDPEKTSELEKKYITERDWLDRYIYGKFNKLRTESTK